MKNKNYKKIMQAMILIVFISVLSSYIYFTNEKQVFETPTGFVIYDNNPNVDVVVPDMDLKNKFGYFTGHGEMTEREDNKFDVVLSSSPGIPGLVHADQIPEAIVEIKGMDSNNKSININSTIDVLEEGAKDYDEIKTAVFAMDSVPIENATITLPKTAYTQYILRCEEFDQEKFECVGEGNDINGWEITEIPFTDNGDTITFSVTHFTGYAGGGTNETNSANLTIWDNTDTGMFHGDQEKFVLENVEFFANYSMLNGSAINGGGVTCNINFSDGTNAEMNFVSTYQLYEYDRTFNSTGNHSYNISCDGTLMGYVALNITDNVTISSLTPPQGQAGNTPSVTTPVFNTTSVNGTEHVNASVNYTDDEGDVGTLYFNWYINKSWVFEEIVTGVANNSNISRQLDAGNYSDRDNITIEVRPYDGTTNGTPKNSTTFFQICLNPYDGLTLTVDTILCGGTYNLADPGDNGVIISGADNINITCDGTKLFGTASNRGIVSAYTFNVIKGCTVENYEINIRTSGDNNTIINNTVFDSSYAGIDVAGDHNNITNNTMYNSSAGYGLLFLETGALNTLVWGNKLLGVSGSTTNGIRDRGTGSNFCVNDLYGNYYDNYAYYGGSGDTTGVPENDCGPAPNATVWLYDKSAQYNWSWGSTEAVTFNNLREAVYNTENNRTIKGFPESGTFLLNDTHSVRSNITLDCNGIVFDDRAGGEIALYLVGESFWNIKNCTFNRYRSIYLDGSSHNNTIINNTFLNTVTISGGATGIDLYGNHNNITNNTFYNHSAYSAIDVESGALNNMIWGNKILGVSGGSEHGIRDSGTNTNVCVNDLYGNYYDLNVGYTRVPEDDCGPAPNSTVWLYDKSEQYNWSWGSTGAVTFNNLREAVYNTENNRTIKGFPESGTFLLNDTHSVRSNITLDCNGIVFDDRAGGEIALYLVGESFWNIKNCTFNRYRSIYLDGSSHNNTIINNTFLNTVTVSGGATGIDLYGNHNNITNNTFYNHSTYSAIDVESGALNNMIWGNKILGVSGGSEHGIRDSGTNTNVCVNDLYGNYYDLNVGYTRVLEDDCGPAPNSTVWLYDKSEQYNWSWGSTGAVTFNNLREAVYNTENNRTIKGFPESGTFWLNDTDTVRSNITLDCNGILFDDKATSENGIRFRGDVNWFIKNCTFNRYSTAIYIDSTDYNSTVINNTILSSTAEGVYLVGDHNNITNNTFFNNTQEGIEIDAAGAINNNVWGNRFLGLSNDGIADSGTSTNLCVNDLYGNYYDNNVDYGAVIENDCGPVPNATVWLYDKSEQYNWSWGSTGAVTFNNLREAVYNTENNRTIKGFPESGTFWLNDTDTVRSNITLDCNGIVFDDKATSENGIRFRGDVNWFIKNCTFNRYASTIYIDSTDYNNTIINNTFLSSTVEAAYLIGDHNNITNNTFFNNTQEGIDIDVPGAINNLIWGNRFLGLSNDGIADSGTSTNLCVNDLYGNYYNGSVDTGGLDVDDCGPTPNATVIVDKNGLVGISWGTNLSVKDIQEGVYNTWNGSSKLLQILPASGPYNGSVTTFRNNIVINCSNNTLMGGGAGTGITISNGNIKIQNCTFNNFDTGISLKSSYNLIYNNTFLGNDLEAILFTTGVDSFNVIKHNNFTSNNDDAIDGNAPSATSTGNNITENTFDSNTDYAITIASTNMLYTSIWRNNFRNNRVGTSPYTQVNNVVQNTTFNVSSQGNYWTDYDSAAESCNDANSDGFCDLPQDNITGVGAVNDSWPYAAFLDYFNTRPVITLSLKPIIAYSNSTLNATANYTDVESDIGIVYFEWFRNNTLFWNTSFGSINANANISDNLTSSNFTKWTNITVQVTGFDGVYNSTPINVSINISNSLPEIRAAVISPSTAYSNDTINATFVTWDIDGDSLTAYFDWFVNGTYRVANYTSGLNNNTNISSFLKYTNYTKWSNVTVMVTLYDGVTNSTPQNLTINISNYLAESVKAAFSPDTIYTNTTVNITSKVWDIDGDAMTIYYDWFINKTHRFANLSTGLANNTNVSSFLNHNNFTKWSNLTVQVVVYDGASNSTPVNYSANNVTNSLPEIRAAVISPSTAYANETVNATFVTWDMDNSDGGDLLTAYFDWFVNGTYRVANYTSGLNNNTNISSFLRPANFSKWSNVTVMVTLYDTVTNSTPQNLTINISNFVPIAINPVISPSNPEITNTLNATLKVWDIDSDVMTVYIDWFVNEIRNVTNVTTNVANGTNVSTYLGTGNYSGTDNITFQYAIYDGFSNSTPINSSYVYLTNVAPSIAISLKPTTAYSNSTLNVTANYTDLNNDVGKVYFNWFVNGTLTTSTVFNSINSNTNISDNLTSGNFSRWSNVTVQATPYDGTVNGTAVNVSINISNNRAESISVAFSPETIYSNTTVNITSKVWDIDGDAMIIYYDWFVNKTHRFGNFTSGLANNTNVSSFLKHDNFTKWSNLTVQVVVYDGISNSTPINYSANNVTNIAPEIRAAVISPSTAYANDTVNATFVAMDIDNTDGGDQLTAYFDWYVNNTYRVANFTTGVNNNTNISSFLKYTNYTKWSNVTVMVTLYDTVTNSTPQNLTINISNYPPESIQGALSPDIIYTNTTVNATSKVWDIDGDAMTIYYDWFVNKTHTFANLTTGLANNTNVSSFLSHNNYTKWSNVSVQVIVYDGATNSTAMNISWLNVTNINSNINATDIYSPNNCSTEKINGSGIPSDIDFDVQTIYFNWFVTSSTNIARINYSEIINNVATGENISRNLSTDNFTINDNVTLQITANDGAGNSSARNTTTITIRDCTPQQPDEGGEGTPTPPSTPPEEEQPEEELPPEVILPPICESSTTCNGWSTCRNKERTRTCTSTSSDCTSSSYNEKESCCSSDNECNSGYKCISDKCILYQSCTDSDESDSFTTGYVYGLLNGAEYKYDDRCADKTKVVEYICSGLNPTRDAISCVSGCEDGKCNQCIPNIICEDWTTCEEKTTTDRSGKKNTIYQKTRVCKDLNKCLGEYTDTAECCPSGIVGRAFGNCNLFCEPKEDCQWSSCSGGIRYETCTKTNRLCQTTSKLTQRERCKIDEEIPEKIDETLVISPDDEALDPSDEHIAEIIDAVKDIIPEDWKEVEITTEKVDQIVTEHTEDTLILAEKETVEEEQADDALEELKEETELGQETSVENTHTTTTVIVENTETGEKQEVTAVTVAFEGEETLDNNNNDITQDVQEINNEVDVENLDKEEVQQDVDDLNNILDEIGEAIIPEEEVKEEVQEVVEEEIPAEVPTEVPAEVTEEIPIEEQPVEEEIKVVEVPEELPSEEVPSEEEQKEEIILPEEKPVEEKVKVIEPSEEGLEETFMDKVGKAVDVIIEKTQPEEEKTIEDKKTEELIKSIEEGLKETELGAEKEELAKEIEKEQLAKDKKGIVVKGDESAEELAKLLEEHNIKVAERLVGTTITENDVVFASSKVKSKKDTKPVILGLNVGVTEGANRKSKELKIKIITGESKSELITRYRDWLYKVEKVQNGKSKKINNIKVIEFIPKHVANSAKELVFVGEKPIILQDDPIIEWRVDKLSSGEKKEFSYIVKRKLTKVETVSIVSGEYEDKVEKNALPCTDVTYSETKLPVTTYKEESKQLSNAENKVKEAGYSVIMNPFNVKCTGDNIDFTINIPDKYTDVDILKCTGTNCEPKKKETINELTCGNKIIRETVVEEEFAGFLPIDATQVSINVSEFKEAIASMKDKIEYYDEKTGLISATIDEEAIQPQNPMLRIIGAPLKFKFKKLLEKDTIITIPLIEPVGFENNSFGLYINTGKDAQGLDNWKYIESDVNYETKLVSANIVNISNYLDQNNEIEAGVMGLLCLNCLNATLELVYTPKIPSRDAVILVHGLASSPAKYEEIIKDIKLTEQPFQAWTFAYPTTDEIEKNAKEFARLIEEQQDKFDRIYIAAHSLGGITTQQALYYAYQENLKQPADKPAYKFVNKVRRVVAVGSPNEGTPGIEPYKKLFQFLINAKTDTPLFNVNSDIISKLSQGLITPQVPTIDYYVIAGNKPYPFSNVFFEKVLANGQKVVVPNDGIVGVKSAQHIGDEYINNTCQNYWEVGLTHTELLANPAGRKQIEKIVAEGVLGETSVSAIMGYNQYYQFHISDCSEKDMYMVVGKEVDEKEIFDETGCNCGDGYCAKFENSETCPSDCPTVAKPIVFGKTTAITIIILLLLIVLLIIGSAAYVPYGIYKHHVNKRRREMHFLEAEKVNLEHYIHDVSRKMHIDKVREMLISKGWNKEVIEKYIKQVEIKSLNALETYTKELVGKGIHPLKVREHLIRKGWHPTHVDRVLEVNFEIKPEHVLEHTTRQLDEYIKHRLSKGGSRAQIKEELLRRGWQETIINKVLPVKPEDYLTDIKAYVKERLKSKASILTIRNELVRKGWQEEVIDKALGITSESVEKELRNYINNALKTRKNKLLIKEELVKKGWPALMIENMLGLDEETSVYELGKYIKERLSSKNKKNKKQSIIELRNELISKGWLIEIVDRYLRISDEEGIRILKAYIDIEAKEGKDISEIKKKLIEKGWNKEVIENCIKFDNRKKIEQLKDYVKYELFQKHTTLEIREKLLEKHWNKNIVDELLGFNQEIGLELLINYIKIQHNKGNSRLEIRKKLVEKGWSIDVVDRLLNFSELDVALLVMEYTKEQLKHKKHINDIREALLRKGWKTELVDKVLGIGKDAGMMMLKEYVYNAETHGYDDEKIKKALETSGWNKKIVEVVVKKGRKHLINQQTKELKRYIYKQLNDGRNINAIKEVLERKGWNNDMINSMTEICIHIYEKRRTEELVAYIKRELKQGISRKKITEKLVLKGWNKYVIDEIFRKLDN